MLLEAHAARLVDAGHLHLALHVHVANGRLLHAVLVLRTHQTQCAIIRFSIPLPRAASQEHAQEHEREHRAHLGDELAVAEHGVVERRGDDEQLEGLLVMERERAAALLPEPLAAALRVEHHHPDEKLMLAPRLTLSVLLLRPFE